MIYAYILPFGKGKTSYANELFSLESVYLKKDLPKYFSAYNPRNENPEIIRRQIINRSLKMIEICKKNL